MASFSPPPGTSDILPDEIQNWNFIQAIANKVFPLYGYGEIRTPVFEYTEVFQKSIGTETEVVKKEMYTFQDRGGRSLTLRPEGTAGVMRALMKTDAPNGVETKVYYLGPMFRGERPAAGRKRQFHQVGTENVGKIGPEYDAENIIMLMHYIDELKITGTKLLINTRGTAEDREPAEKELRKYLEPYISNMCPDCKDRHNKNIWRILDCKSPECQEIIQNSPNLTNFFTPETQEYFNKVINILKEQNIDFEIDSRLVRGLDYYQHTVFEVTHSGLGGQNAIAGGGRYKITVPGSKKPLIGVGFAAGIERLLMAQESSNNQNNEEVKHPIFLVNLGDNAKKENLKLAFELRKNSIFTLMELEDNKSMKAQMRSAGKNRAEIVLIRGEDELKNGTIILKNMVLREQQEIKISELYNHIS
jgi:histidyl-tRNA synthetase